MTDYSQWPIVERAIPGWPMCIGRAWGVRSDLRQRAPNVPMVVRVIRRNYGPDWLVTITPPVIPREER